jgi:acyl-CoA thioesterase FadM
VAKGLRYVLQDTHAPFLISLLQLLVGSKPMAPLSKDRFTLQSGLYSIAQNAIIATCEHTNVCYDYARLTKIDMPSHFREALEAVMMDGEANS